MWPTTRKRLSILDLDSVKAFDKFSQKELFKMLGKLDLFGEDIRRIQNSYWEQTTCKQVENKFSKYSKNLKGYKTRMFFFSLNLNFTVKQVELLEVLLGFIIIGYNLNNKRHRVDGKHRKETTVNLLLKIGK